MRIVSILLTCVLAFCVAGVAQANTWVNCGTASGGIAVYYNTNAQGFPAEQPANQAYFRAQFNNSKTLLNGAAFSFAAPYNSPLMFNDLGQYGFDLIVAAPTDTIPVPTLYAYDNGNNTLGGRILAGSVAWALNDYKGGAVSGPGDPASGIINSTVRGNSGTASVTNVMPITGGFTVDFSSTLYSDGLFHWYTIGLPDTPMSSYVQGGQYLTGNFRASGTLTYLTAQDTTPGMDFYAGSVTMQAELAPVPEPLSMIFFGTGLVGVFGFVARRRMQK